MENVEILTSNATYENGECVGGYHEIHKINYLQNAQHLIATIDSIIKNNLLYGCEDSTLEDVVVSCDDQKVVDEVNKHYSGQCGKVKVYVERTNLLIESWCDMSRTITYDSQGNDITCMKEFDALLYPCKECDRTDCEERGKL